MKIGIYAGEIPSTTFIERLVSGLALSDNEVIVFGTKSKPVKKRKNVSLIGINPGSGKLGLLIFYFKYYTLTHLFRRSELKKLRDQKTQLPIRIRAMKLAIIWQRLDVFHLQWVKGIESYVWLKDLDVKLIASLRGAHINYSPLADAKLAETYREIFPKIDAFHGVSEAICREATKYGADLEKCHVVYSGFPIQNFPKENWNKNKDLSKKNKIEVISVGRSHWKKGYHFALDGFKILKDKGFQFEYTVIGAEGNEELMFQRHQLELTQEVEFLNNVPFNQVIDRIRKADVLLLPSVEEGIANVVLEAMLLGTLVISTNCGGMKESIEDLKEGLIIPVRDPQAIADTIEHTSRLNTEEYTAITEGAYSKICIQHNEAKMVSDMLSIYKSIEP